VNIGRFQDDGRVATITPLPQTDMDIAQMLAEATVMNDYTALTGLVRGPDVLQEYRQDAQQQYGALTSIDVQRGDDTGIYFIWSFEQASMRTLLPLWPEETSNWWKVEAIAPEYAEPVVVQDNGVIVTTTPTPLW
jgi:hypothetical protein